MKYLVKKSLSALGVDVRLIRNVTAHHLRMKAEAWQSQWNCFQRFPIRTILDIGANTGQFAEMIHRVLPAARIYSFEPLRDCFLKLEETLAVIPFAKGFNVALGDENNSVKMFHSDFSPSSSLLPMGELHKQNFPSSASANEEVVHLRRLDDVLAVESLNGDLLVKIDVQGYEEKVILGGIQTLSRARFAVVEMSCYELYVKQPLFDGIYTLMRSLGFIYRGNIDQIESSIDNRILSVDAFFEREEPSL